MSAPKDASDLGKRKAPVMAATGAQAEQQHKQGHRTAGDGPQARRMPFETSVEKRAGLESLRDAMPGNSVRTQEARMLAALAQWQITTFEASRFLDIYDPRARVMALRNQGRLIVLNWVHVPTECGRLHRIGAYSLVKGRSAEVPQ